MTIRIYLLFLLMTFSVSAAVFAETEGRDNFVPNMDPTLNVSPRTGEIKIDGELGDAGWRNAAVADGFCEHSPGDMTPPPVETKVYVTYDESHFYAAFVCNDNPDEIRASLRERDNIFRDDYCGILLDTYGDQSWGYEIFVNPLGIQGDLRQLASGGEEMSFDIIFESIGQVTDSGYQVEIAIPFASLRFPNTEVQNWRINFWRDRQRDSRYRYTWSAISRDDPCFMCQWGGITGIEGIKPSTNFEILPSVTAFQYGTRVDPDIPNSTFDNYDPDGDISLGVRYGITPNSSAEITINPDFSQVESDAGQIDVNTPFGLSFPERRPFFQEGSDLFSTRINAVYTRTINNPNVAGRFTGQFGNYSLAYLTAYDDNSPILVPLSERSIRALFEESFTNIFRLRRAFGENSYLGILGTNRQLSDFEVDGAGIDGGSGSSYGVDGSFRFLRNYQFAFQVMGSYTEEPGSDLPEGAWLIDTTGAMFDRDRYTVELDGESFNGHALNITLSRSARYWNGNISYHEFSPTFRTDNGNNTRNDTRTLETYSYLEFNPNREWLDSWRIFVMAARVWDHGGKVNLDPGTFADGARDEWIKPELSFTLKGQTEVEVGYIFSRERFAGEIFPGIRRWDFEASTRFSEYITLSGSATFGHSVYRSRSNPELGEVTQIGLWAGIKPIRQLYFETSFDYAKMNHRDTYFEVHPDAEEELYSGYIIRSRMTYLFTREWYLRLVVQYDDFDDIFNIEPLLTWQLNPFTVFYVGMNSHYQHYDINDYDPDLRTFDKSEWELNTRQFFAKLQYLFRV